MLVLNRTAGKKAKVAAAKVTAPRPFNLPSLRSENSGLDPATQIVPTGGGGWGGARPEDEDAEAAAAEEAQKQAALVPPATGGQVWGGGAGRAPVYEQPQPQPHHQRNRFSSEQEFPTLHGKENVAPEQRDSDPRSREGLDLRPGLSCVGSLRLVLIPLSVNAV